MLLLEQEIDIPAYGPRGSLLAYLGRAVRQRLPQTDIPVRFVVTESDSAGYKCELGVLARAKDFPVGRPTGIFQFAKREMENTQKFNAVMIVPTGIGAEIGGHAGDAGPAARLLAGACDTLITHPNVVNGSDVNEMPENCLYVEGSVLTRLLMGTVGLQTVRSNRVILIMGDHEDEQISEFSVNAVSAARATLGLECERVVKMASPIRMRAKYSSSGSAVGRVDGLDRLCEVLGRYRSEFDAVGITSVIDLPKRLQREYFESQGDMVNPWGGVEAVLTHAVSMLFDVPSAHAPMAESMEMLNVRTGVVDPRMSAEAVSTCFLHCVLKGLHRSPRIVRNCTQPDRAGLLTATHISCLVIPDGCVGLPTLAALEQGIPVIAVRENRNRMKNDLRQLPFGPRKLFVVDNYLEAVGIISALKAGVSPDAVRRPLRATHVTCEGSAAAKRARPAPLAPQPSVEP